MRKSDLVVEYVARHRDTPFEWATWDCCQFVGLWIYELTGIDHREAFPAYANEEEARDILKNAGGLFSLVSSVLKPIEVCRAMKGDIVLANDEGGAALGICLGVHSAHVSPAGMTYLLTASSIRAWRVE